jgi:hypothetical protein
LRLEESRFTGRVFLGDGPETIGRAFVVEGKLCGLSLPEHLSPSAPPIPDAASNFLSNARSAGIGEATERDEQGAAALREWIEQDIVAALNALSLRGLPDHLELRPDRMRHAAAGSIAVCPIACFLGAARALFAADQEPIDRSFQDGLSPFHAGILFARSSGRPIPLAVRGFPLPDLRGLRALVSAAEAMCRLPLSPGSPPGSAVFKMADAAWLAMSNERRLVLLRTSAAADTAPLLTLAERLMSQGSG